MEGEERRRRRIRSRGGDMGGGKGKLLCNYTSQCLVGRSATSERQCVRLCVRADLYEKRGSAVFSLGCQSK